MKTNCPTTACPARPEPILGATWQAGVTRDNASYRVFIDGEPAPLCFAANHIERWALCYYDEGGADYLKRDAFGKAKRIRREGRIEIRRIAHDEQFGWTTFLLAGFRSPLEPASF